MSLLPLWKNLLKGRTHGCADQALDGESSLSSARDTGGELSGGSEMSAASQKVDWLGPRSGLIHCPKCDALMGGNECPLCKHKIPSNEWMIVHIEGNSVRSPENQMEAILTQHGSNDMPHTSSRIPKESCGNNEGRFDQS